MKRKKKATKLKIQVVEDGKHINIPAMPFWLINFIINIIIGLAKITLIFLNEKDEEFHILNRINSNDIKSLIREIRKYKPFDLLDIEYSDKIKVKISTL
ncbi:MAG: hypothetical protein LOD89_07960 [Tissierellales bacterium]|jgi:hypothetical protein